MDAPNASGLDEPRLQVPTRPDREADTAPAGFRDEGPKPGIGYAGRVWVCRRLRLVWMGSFQISAWSRRRRARLVFRYSSPDRGEGLV